jgi:hypothetical protein
MCKKQKLKLMPCTHCGYTPKKKALTTKKTVKPKKSKKIVHPYPSGKLPDYDELRGRDDIFAKGRVISSAFESGKKR